MSRIAAALAANTAVLANLGLQHLEHSTEITLHLLPDELPKVTAKMYALNAPSTAPHTLTHTVLELSTAPSTPPAFDKDRACQEARERLHAYIYSKAEIAHRSLKVEFAYTRNQQKRRWDREDAARAASQFINSLGNPFEGSVAGLCKAFGVPT